MADKGSTDLILPSHRPLLRCGVVPKGDPPCIDRQRSRKHLEDDVIISPLRRHPQRAGIVPLWDVWIGPIVL